LLDDGTGSILIDPQDVDFVLQGSVTVVDSDGNGAADALGRPDAKPGKWSGEVRSYLSSSVQNRGVRSAYRTAAQRIRIKAF